MREKWYTVNSRFGAKIGIGSGKGVNYVANHKKGFGTVTEKSSAEKASYKNHHK